MNRSWICIAIAEFLGVVSMLLLSFPVHTLARDESATSFSKGNVSGDASVLTAEETANLRAAKEFFEMLFCGEIEGATTLLADDLFWCVQCSQEELPAHGVWHGRDGFVEWTRDYDKHWLKGDAQVSGVWPCENAVIVYFVVECTARSTGKVFRDSGLAVLSYEDGKLVSLLGYHDSASSAWSLQP